MSWIILLLAAWVIHRASGRLRDSAAYKAWTRPVLRYLFEPRQNWALALAHPIASARDLRAFANARAPGMTAQQAQTLRASLLHIFGLRTSLTDAEVKNALPELLQGQWFRIDLDKLRLEDEPRAAMAFACARLAFAVRVATLLGWLEPALQWQVLYQNAQRAQDCFGSWNEFGAALARGRQQWIAASRADSLGVAIDEATLAKWLASRSHPWRRFPWQGLTLFTPPSMK